MKKLIAIVSWLCLTSSAGADECRSLNDVEWILGEWTTSPNRVLTHETWYRVSDVTFEGESTTKTVSGDEVVNYETLRLVAMSDGVFYIAKVNHNDLPVPFRLTQCSKNLAVFENPAHDSPQRLVYRLMDTSTQSAPALEVRVEGDGMNDFSLLFHGK